MPAVRQLLPEPAEIEPAAAHAAAHRPARAGRPWVLVNMVASVDGATALEGTSGGLGGPADKVVFSAIRAVADVILVAARTARAESYGPPRTPPERRAERIARGQSPFPRLAVITASLDLDVDGPRFADAAEPPLVFTVADAPQDRRDSIVGRAEVVDMGDGLVDLPGVLGDLHKRGARTVLVEGGPGLNGQLVAAGLVDELNVSVSPLLVGGDSSRLAHGAAARPRTLSLSHLWTADDLLFARYLAT